MGKNRRIMENLFSTFCQEGRRA